MKRTSRSALLRGRYRILEQFLHSADRTHHTRRFDPAAYAFSTPAGAYDDPWGAAPPAGSAATGDDEPPF
mgnify:CR=1 FL=1